MLAAGRTEGCAPLRDYAAIGDGRTVALVARDGSIDWLPVPNLDSPAVFAAVLDSERGGSFRLAPESPYDVRRRYLAGTNVLETTFVSAAGSVRVTDALTLSGPGLLPFRELQRRIEGVSGRVRLHWQVEPRFGFAGPATRRARRHGRPVATAGADAVALVGGEGDWRGSIEVTAGTQSVFALSFAHQEPLVLPSRDELDRRFEETCAAWRRWTAARTYDGPWREAVIRSALALKLLVFAPSGAIAAAATASLPEEIGGSRNWDYRYSWIRDSAFALDALLRLGCVDEARAYFWWLMHATQLTAPRLHVLYRLDGGTRVSERTLALAGYRGSRPVRIGNGAATQLQLDTYGELLQTAWLYACDGNRIDKDIGRRLGDIADFVCDHWEEPDAGIWEVRSPPQHFTQSKMMCAIALERAAELGGNAERRLEHAAAVRSWVDEHCWSDRRRAYGRASGSDELDASVLLAVLHGYGDPHDGHLRATVDAIDRELRDGPFVRRYDGADGLPGREGAFVACSFWLVEALALTGRVDDAASLMDETVALCNDVGLLSEEIDPANGAFLGNLPQGLSHLSLVSAATTLAAAAG